MNYADIKYPVTSGGGSGTETYTNIADLPLTGNTTGEQAFVSENNRLYIWTGTGWYNIALVNTTPTAITGANGSYQFASDGTPIVLTLVSTDPEGLPITWSYAVTSGSLENGGGTTATVSQAANVFTITPTTTEDYAGEFSLTFTASDGVNLATTTSSFALMFAILNSKYTTLMLKTSGTNAQQNNTFIDSSTNNFTITRNGNPTQGTFSPYGDKWSNYFDGSGDYLSVSDNTAFTLTSDFTIECFFFTPVLPTSINVIAAKWAAGGQEFIFDYGVRDGSNARTIRFYWGPHSVAAPLLTSPNNAFNVGEWVHVAIVRNGSTIAMYINGVSVVSGTNATAASDLAQPLHIGAYGAGPTDYLNGYISNFRIIKGTAVYTSNFTPPTEPLTAIAGTVLLTCQSNSFKDNSTNNFAITPNGDVKVQRFSPFDIEPYDSSVIGGSAYFDGSGDSLSAPDNDVFEFNTGDFVVEGWFYPTTSGTLRILLSHYIGTSGWSLELTTGDLLTFWSGNGGTAGYKVTSTNKVITNQWNYCVASRNGTSLNTFVNGVSGTAVTDSTNIASNTAVMAISGTSTGSWLFPGYASDIRIRKGSAVTSSVVPTVPLTPVTNTSLLLKCTDAGIYDASGNNDIETVGNAQVSTSVVKYGSGSMYFDGTTGYILGGSQNNSYQFGTGDFTIELWLYVSSIPTVGNSKRVFHIGANNSTGNIQLVIVLASGYLRIDVGASTAISGTINVCTGTWNHIAISRSGTSLKMFVNGSQNGSTATVSTNLSQNTLEIGNDTTVTSSLLNGYISDFRITKGLARYTANFTPPTSELLG